MKKLIAIATALLFTVGGTLHAQNANQTSATQTTAKCDMKNCCIKKDGLMVQMTEGKESTMDHPITLAGHQTIYPDGAVDMGNGTRMMLMEGDCMDMKGNIHIAKTNFTYDEMIKKSAPAEKKN